MSELEKRVSPDYLEDGKDQRLTSDHASDQAFLAEFSKEEERSIIHRIDRRLVVTVGFMYCISLMDRTNLSSANIAGMSKELVLIGWRYQIITLVFFTTYVVFQFPSTIVIKKIGPRLHLGTITLLWGACMIGMGFVKNWRQLAALRVILGILEAGFFPGSVYLLSTWYCRYELQKRYASFYVIGSFASALAGILAYGLMQMNGLANLSGWRWIFIMEGIITCLIAFAGYVLIVNFPDDSTRNWHFLNDREIRFVIARINRDRSDAVTDKFAWSKFLRPALDIKVWGFALIFCFSTTLTYALAYFLPVILNQNMGFSIAASQCLVAPPYAAAAIWMYLMGVVGDRYRLRGPLVVVNALLAIIGLPVMGFAASPGVRYFGVFLACMGGNANIPTSMTYQANNIRGHWKRAFASASLVGMGGVGGIIGSLIFRTQDAPGYKPGIWACLTSQLLILVIVALLTVKFKWDNRKAARGEKMIEGLEGFRYTL